MSVRGRSSSALTKGLTKGSSAKGSPKDESKEAPMGTVLGNHFGELPVQVILYRKGALHFLRKFVIRDHSEENLFFYLDVEKLRKVSSADELEKECDRMVRLFLKSTSVFDLDASSLQISIDHEVRERLMEEYEGGEISRFMFNDAQSEVWKSVKGDILMRFTTSPECQLMINYGYCSFMSKLRDRGCHGSKYLKLSQAMHNAVFVAVFHQYLKFFGEQDLLVCHIYADEFAVRTLREQERVLDAKFLYRSFIEPTDSKVRDLLEKADIVVMERQLVAPRSDFTATLDRAVWKRLEELYRKFCESEWYQSFLFQAKETESHMRATESTMFSMLSSTSPSTSQLGVIPSTVNVHSASEGKDDIREDRATDSHENGRPDGANRKGNPNAGSAAAGSAGSVSELSEQPLPQVSVDEMLVDWELLDAYRKFSRLEHSEENILFYVECMEYESLPPEKRRGKSRAIFKLYLKQEADYQVAIDQETIGKIRTRLLEEEYEGVFLEAKEAVKRMIAQDSYLRFLGSPQYREIMRKRQNDCIITEPTCCVVS